MLTLENFNKINNGSVFANGVLKNSPDELYMTNFNLGKKVKWLAKKGYGNDWAVYCHWDEYSLEYVEKNGDKVTSKENILKCIQCDEEVLKLYRY